MKQSFKYGLSNAHILLNKIKHGQSTAKDKSIINQKEDKSQSPLNKSFDSEQTFNDRSQAQFERPKGKVTLSEIIINKHLEQTRVKYARDLEQMTQNRDNLLLAIEIVGQKLLLIKELESKNKNYQKVINQKKQGLADIMLEHRKVCQQLYYAKISVKQQHKKICIYLKELIEQCQADSRFQKFCDQWDEYSKELQKNQQLLQTSRVMLNHDKIMQIFKKKQEFKSMRSEEQQIVLTKKPSKKVDSSQKALLLGNLKQFSKKFKIP